MQSNDLILQSASLSGVPGEILRQILLQVPYSTLERICRRPPNQRLAQVCQGLLTDNKFWQEKYLRDILPFIRPGTQVTRNYYVTTYNLLLPQKLGRDLVQHGRRTSLPHLEFSMSDIKGGYIYLLGLYLLPLDIALDYFSPFLKAFSKDYANFLITTLPEYLRQTYRLARGEVKTLPTYPKDINLKRLLYGLVANRYSVNEAEVRSEQLKKVLAQW